MTRKSSKFETPANLLPNNEPSIRIIITGSCFNYVEEREVLAALSKLTVGFAKTTMSRYFDAYVAINDANSRLRSRLVIRDC